MDRRHAILALTAAPAWARIPDRDEAFLEEISRRGFLFFWEQADPHTGLVRDRARTDGSPAPSAPQIASIAATGFGLTILCIAHQRRWHDAALLQERVTTTLRFFAEQSFHQHGWFYHFVDMASGERRWNCEISSIDTALLLGGVLTARAYFRHDAVIQRLATAIYHRLDFRWMLNGDPLVLSHGYRPETGLLSSRWKAYSEANILYLLGLGSPTTPLPPASWYAWSRPAAVFGPYRYVSGGPLFTHQYSHAWVDFRGRRDAAPSALNYFDNSVIATAANRAFCLSLAGQFPRSYSADIWGVTASDSQKGYIAWGEPPLSASIDGTVVPCASVGSLMLSPELCLPVLHAMRERFGERIYGRYGFTDAFNPTTGWIDPEVIGIDQGITLLSIENARTGVVWRWFGRNPEMARALQQARFRRV